MDAVYLEYLINNTNQIIYTINEEGIFTYVSTRWKDQLGHDLSDVVEKHYSIFIHEEDIEKMSDFFQKVKSGKEDNVKCEHRTIHIDGTVRWYDASCNFVQNQSPKESFFLGSCTDITDKKNIQTNLENERLKFKLLAENCSDAIFSMTPEGVFTFTSTHKINLGYEPEDLISLQYIDIVHEDFHSLLLQYQSDLLSGISVVENLEILVKHKNGDYRWIHVKGNFIQEDETGLPSFIGIAIDINEQVLQRNKVAKDLKVLKSVFEESLGGYWEWDLKNNNMFLSAKLKKTIGYKKTDYQNIIRSPLLDVMDKENFNVFWLAITNYIKSNPKKPFTYQLKFKNKIGQRLTTVLSGVITERRGARIDKIIGCLVDVTELSNIKDKLEIQNEELKLLRYTEQKATKEIAYQIMIGQECERHAIAQELHDGVNQLLFAAKIQLQESKCKEDQLFENGISLIEKSINEIKYIASNQNSFLLYKKSLYEGLNELILSLPSNKINFSLKITNKFQIKVSDDKSIIILRIIQELIHNILKHSDATKANIYVKKTTNEISILVVDNGIGFDIQKTKKGNGLVNLQNKLKVINGNYIVNSQIGKGTLFYINFHITA